MSEETLKQSVKFETKETASCSREISVTVPGSEVEKTFHEIVKEVAGQVTVQGFRKGKVPVAIVKARFASYIAEDLEKALQRGIFDRLQEELDLVSVTEIDDKKVKPEAGKDYAVVVKADVAPAFELPDYKNMEVSVAKAGDHAKAVEERLDYLRNLYSEYATVESPAEDNDMLKVSYESDFELPADAGEGLKRMVKADTSWIWLHEPEYVPGANAALKGAKAGETREFTSNFPADWREAALAGKAVKYTMKVNEVQRKETISDNAVLAERLHVKNADELLANINKDVEAKAKHDREEAVREKLMEALVAKAGEFELPKSILESETEREFSKIANQLVKSEDDVKKFQEDKEKHLADARKTATANLRKFFITGKIAKNEKVEVSSNELDDQIHAMSAYFGYKEKDVRKTLQRNGGLGEIHAGILSTKVLDFIAKTAKVNEI